MAASVDTSKKCWRQIAMYATGVWCQVESEQNIFFWSTKKINTQKVNKEYFCNNKNWTFKITNNRKFYAATINTGHELYNGDIICSVQYDDHVFSNPIRARRINESVYKVNFPINVVNVQQNVIFSNGYAVFVFKCIKGSKIVNMSLQRKEVKPGYCRMGCKTDFYLNLLLALATRSYTDFVIHVKGSRISFAVPKSILAVRSHYFRQYIQENCIDGEPGKIEIDTTDEAMSIVIKYMYTGQIDPPSSQTTLNEIIKLSQMLGMTKMETKCRIFSWIKNESKPALGVGNSENSR